MSFCIIVTSIARGKRTALDLLEIELLFIYFGVTNSWPSLIRTASFKIRLAEGKPGCLC
jgi:hypothetical protein